MTHNPPVCCHIVNKNNVDILTIVRYKNVQARFCLAVPVLYGDVKAPGVCECLPGFGGFLIYCRIWVKVFNTVHLELNECFGEQFLGDS